jgi:hypothetical protein
MAGSAESIERSGTVCGYRILRHAPDRHGGRCHHGARDDGDGTRSSVTVVSFEPVAEDGRAMRLVERLDALEGECVPRVLDVCRDGDRAVLVVLEYCGDALSTILAAGGRLDGGEVVTITAPILAALTGIHDRGFVHGGLSLSSIAIGTGGKPLLLGLERAEQAPSTGDRREWDRRVGDDLRAFSDLVSDLAETVVDGEVRERTRRAAETIRAGAESPFSPATRSAAEVRLFEIADPVALALALPMETAVDDRPERAARSLAPGSERRPRRRERRRARDLVREVGTGLLRRAPRVTARVIGSLSPTIRWVRSGGRGRRVLLAGIAAIVTAVVVALSVPTTGPRAQEPHTGRANRAVIETTGPRDPNTPVPGTPSAAEPPQNGSAVPVDDDAVAATRGALDVIAGCAADRSIECWGRALEPGSDLLGTVTARGTTELPAALLQPVEALDIAEREDFGDARLVSLTPSDGTTPASVLMVRTEAGWRIREVFET